MQTHTKTKLSSIVFLILLLVFNVPAIAQEIWGMTKYGGDYNKGVIFKINEDASGQEVVYSFENSGNPEGRMIEYEEGIFYGITSEGGTFNCGTIFRFSLKDGVFAKVLDLNGEETGKVTGIGRAGGLLLAQNRKIYGMTANGGIYEKGILFELDPKTETFLKLHDFDGDNSGSEPFGGLTETDDGSIFGMTSKGGEYDAGVIFKFETSTGQLTKVIDLNGDHMGANPLGSLTYCSDGKFYGITSKGGVSDKGVIFSFSSEDRHFSTLFEFDGGETGSYPDGSLLEADNGKLYGTTRNGGNYDAGVIFEYNLPENLCLKKYDFTRYEFHYYGVLKQVPNGDIYLLDAWDDFGPVIFEYNPILETVREIYYDVGARGFHVSTGSLMLAANGNLYFWGGEEDEDNDNFLFEFDPEENSIVKHFRRSSSYDGAFPHGNLVQAMNGKFYGQTSRSGKYDLGLIFEFNPVTGDYKKIIDFDGVAVGSSPKGSLIAADNHRLYGMTSKGGEMDKGVLFEFDPLTETIIKLIDFNGEENGEQPNGSLMQASNGNIYGMTTYGGLHNFGVVFEFDLETGTLNKLVDFDGINNGKEPLGSLMEASDGYLYGTSGKLFKIDIVTGSISVIPGLYARGSDLIQASNQKIYGSAFGVFEFDPFDNTIEQINSDSEGTIGKLFEVSDNKLWGMDFGLIEGQGIEDRGNIFEIDLLNYNFISLFDFNGINGSNPDNSGFTRMMDISIPIASCKNEILVLDASGEAMLQPSDIDEGSTGVGVQITISESEFNCNDIGKNAVVLTATDINGNSATCVAEVTVADNLPPVVDCKDVEIYLDASGLAEIAVSDVDNGSFDACGIESMNLDISSLTSENIGENTIELTVTDNFGNTSICSVIVTVTDSIPPEVICKDIEVYLDASGMANIEAADVDNGSNDACGIESMALDITSFSCQNEGENTVQLTVSDVNGNSSTGLATVNVIDTISPFISCITGASRYLEPFKESFTAEIGSEWNADATDNCGIQSLTFLIEGEEGDFTGSSLDEYEMRAGTYTIEWRAWDESNNISSFISIVTIDKRPVTLLFLEKETDYEKEEVHLKIAMMDNILEQGIKGKPLVFVIDEFSDQAVTDENGVATVTMPLIELPAGTHNLTVNFEEDDTYTSGYLESVIITGTNFSNAPVVRVYPNPFSEKLFVEFVAQESANARIDLYDSSGRLVKTIFNKQVEVGLFYKAEFTTLGNPAGLYIYRMSNGGMVNNGKVVFRE